MRTAQPTQLTLDKTLARIHKQFAQQAWRSWSKVFALHDKLGDCLDTGKDSKRFNRAHELLHEGLSEWLNDLAREMEICFRTLLEVAMARPDWIPDDPVQWARAQISRFLTEELEQGAEREEKQWVGPAPLVDPAELKSKPARHLDWFRRACDGPPSVNFLPRSTGWREPWCAPHWVRQSKMQIAGWMRLSVEETNTIIWLARSDFKRQLSSTLDQAEETAYIRLARRPSNQSEETKSPKPGRVKDRSQEFSVLACELWLKARNTLPKRAKVSAGQLSEIARTLDEHRFCPPSKYLEKKCADELKAYNSRHSSSTSKFGGPIRTWGELVQCGDKDHLRCMRRILSRCATTP
jgi:hypothetical protein